ncbi:NlpC/P60 family protein, partial [Phytoactinopolyspora endophytica]|uniref:C40 family peptidase n=1 Tax=Phytoactinopolyspora endophytica TaxID=1642495 RepID=UPI00197B4FF7
LIGVVACAVAAYGTVPAVAEPTPPSQEEIDDARDAERDAGAAVGAAEARLADITAEIDRLRVEAAKAVEAYNGARVELAQAEDDETAARERSEEKAELAAEARRALGQVVAAAYQNGGDLATLRMILESKTGESLRDNVTAFRSVTASQAGAVDQAIEATEVAEEAAAEAEDALHERERATDRAEQAHEQASALLAQEEERATAAETERAQLIAELADARGTTVALEEERQQALEDQERAEREREAEEGPEPRDPADEPDDEPTAAPTPTDQPPDETDGPEEPDRPESPEEPDEPEEPEQPDEPEEPDEPDRPEEPEQPDQTEEPDEPDRPEEPEQPDQTEEPDEPERPDETEEPDEPDEPEQPAPPSSGADAAVAYAHQQVGKPYEWGASGPSSFDCSGLTMRAWEAGGKSLPHWSVAQAQAVNRISYSEMRPGDLIFWSDNGQESGVYHVGLYIGDGKMIHAPRSGKDIEVQSVFYWVDPAFYGRVR